VNKYLQHLLKNVPLQPGVYRMLDGEGNTIYVGKAKNLRNRLRSYFRKNQEHTVKTQRMIEKVTDFQYSVTTTELEALVLETNLIKELRPRYNILMKDDKNFAYIKITTDEDYPRILVVRKIGHDKARYFGPKTAASRYYEILHLLRKIFPFRNCGLEISDLGPTPDKDFSRKRLVRVSHAVIKYPCLDLHIKRCLGPCIGRPDLQEYRNVIDQIVSFLEGRHQGIVDYLRRQMTEAAAEKQFERAAGFRDKIQSIEKLFEFQAINTPDHHHSDVVNFWRQEGKAYFNVFQIRDGKLIDQQNLILDESSSASEDQELLTAFIQNFYGENSDIPREILLPLSSGQDAVLEQWLKQLSGRRVRLNFPQKGKKEKLLEISLENAVSYAKQSRVKWEAKSSIDRDEALEKLAQIAGLPKKPNRIECYDISHLSGTHTVASMAVFEKGFPKRELYRHFKISLNTPGRPDDFLSMQEVLLRRLKYLRPSLTSSGKILARLKNGQLIIKSAGTEIGRLKIISSNKLKTFIGRFSVPGLSPEQLIALLSAKIDSRRIYLCLEKNQSSLWENFGLQKLRVKPEHSCPRGCDWMVLEKLRLKTDQSFSRLPDLIVIDGGKGQLSRAVKATGQYSLSIPLLSLAKKEEEIYLPGSKSPVRLADDDPARLLLQHLRDEAHRFAIEYNRKLRKKDYTVSALEELPGIGKKKTALLLRQFGSLEQIKTLPVEQIAKVIGNRSAQILKNSFN
jgi:excinuclease ABC subunit C